MDKSNIIGYESNYCESATIKEAFTEHTIKQNDDSTSNSVFNYIVKEDLSHSKNTVDEALAETQVVAPVEAKGEAPVEAQGEAQGEAQVEALVEPQSEPTVKQQSKNDPSNATNEIAEKRITNTNDPKESVVTKSELVPINDKINFIHQELGHLRHQLETAISEIKGTSNNSGNIMKNINICDTNILILIVIFVIITIVISKTRQKVYSILL